MEKSCLVLSATHVTGAQSYICVKSHPLDCRGKSDPSPSQRNPQSRSIKQLWPHRPQACIGNIERRGRSVLKARHKWAKKRYEHLLNTKNVHRAPLNITGNPFNCHFFLIFCVTYWRCSQTFNWTIHMRDSGRIFKLERVISRLWASWLDALNSRINASLGLVLLWVIELLVGLIAPSSGGKNNFRDKQQFH